MFELDDHIKFFGALLNIVLGSAILVYIHHLKRTFRLPYLRSIFFYTLYDNILIFIMLVSKYLAIVVGISLDGPYSAFIEKLFAFLLMTLGFLINAFLIRTILEFRLAQDLQMRMRMTQIAFGGALLIFLVFVWFTKEPESLVNLYGAFGLALFLLEIVIMILHLVIPQRSDDPGLRAIGRSYCRLLLVRYGIMVILVLFLFFFFYRQIPRTSVSFLFIGLVAVSVYFALNLSILFWLRRRFAPYSKTLFTSLNHRDLLPLLQNRYGLSSRETEILSLLLEGKSNREIEDRLFISYNTVKNHVYRIYQKCSVNTRLELIQHVSLYQKELQ